MKKSLLLVTLLSIFVNITAAAADGLIAPSQERKRKAEELEKTQDPKCLKQDGQAATADVEEINDCSICMQSLKSDETTITLPLVGKNCGHEYHKQCLSWWLPRSKTCPLCKAPVTITIAITIADALKKLQGIPPSTAYTRKLALTWNHINSLEEFEGLPKDLWNLTFANNKISSVPPEFLAHFSALTHLSFYRNQIKELTPGMFSNLPSLTELNLSFNGISELKAGALKGLVNLKKLSLYGNRIKTIEDDAFAKDDTKERLPLVDLVLSNNGIHNLNAKALEGLPLKNLALRRNMLGPVTQEKIRNAVPADCQVHY